MDPRFFPPFALLPINRFIASTAPLFSRHSRLLHKTVVKGPQMSELYSLSLSFSSAMIRSTRMLEKR